MAQTFPNTFALTLVINLPDRRDRRREAERQLCVIGLPLSPGSVEVFPAIRPFTAEGFPNAGTRGCYLSHVGALKTAIARKASSVLILEDDIQVRSSDVATLQSLAYTLPANDWDIAYFGHRALSGPPNSTEAWAPYQGLVQTAHCYAVNGPAMQPLLNYLESCLTRPPGDPIGGPMHVDGAISMFRQKHPEIITLLAQPVLVHQRSSRSDISVRPLERIPVIRAAVQFVRVATRAFRARQQPPTPIFKERRG